MTGDRELGEQYLNQYYQASGLQFSGVTAEQMIAYYDGQSPNFVATFGGACRDALKTLEPAELTSTLKDLANKNLGKIPDYRDFIPALIDSINGIAHEFRLVEAGTVEGVKQTAAVVTGAAGAYLLGTGVIAALVLLRKGG